MDDRTFLESYAQTSGPFRITRSDDHRRLTYWHQDDPIGYIERTESGGYLAYSTYTLQPVHDTITRQLHDAHLFIVDHYLNVLRTHLGGIWRIVNVATVRG